MKKVIIALTICSLGLLTGCNSAFPTGVPGTKINLADGSSGFFPKQFWASNLDVTISGTNVHLHADVLKSENDPQVIDKSSAGTAAILNAAGNVASGVTAAAVSAAVKSAK